MKKYNRVDIKKARNLWSNGENIYCMPIYERDFELCEGIGISVFTNNIKDDSFNDFVLRYKNVSRHNMRYYILN